MSIFLTHPLLQAFYIAVGGFWLERLAWRFWWFWKERAQTKPTSTGNDEDRCGLGNVQEVHDKTNNNQG